MFRHLLLCLVLAISATAAPFARTQKGVNHAAMHEILTIVGDEGGYCTAEAVGPHVILTAAHCIEGAAQGSILVVVDPDTAPKPAVAGEIVFDNQDHVLIELQHLNLEKSFTQFDNWIDPMKRSVPVQGGKAYYYGAPKSIECRDCYFEGRVLGDFVNPKTDQPGVWFDMLAMPGCSGSAIFDEADQLIGVVSIGFYGAMGAYDLHFTNEQWQHAQEL